MLLEDLQVSPYLKPLHADARWAAFVNRVKAELWKPGFDDDAS